MTTHAHPAVSKSVAARRWLLFTIELIVAVNAVGGAIYAFGGAPNVPREWLEATPFDSYVIPGAILLVAVGGGMALAAIALLARQRLAPELSVAAGLTLIGWITVQVLVVVPKGGFNWLQPAMFAAGVVVAGIGWQLRDPTGESPGQEGASDVDSC